MSKPLSFSGYKRFITCPKYYYYHDVLGEKSDGKSSALVFGSAIDMALNDMLISRNYLKACEIAKQVIEESEIESYFPADIDMDFIQQEHIDLAKSKKWLGENFVELLGELMVAEKLSKNQKEILDTTVKAILTEKSKIILASYFEKVLPLVGSVETVQKEIVTTDGKRGIVDMVVIMKDGKRVLFDNKTATRPYEKDSVLKSPQLALYASMVGAEYAGFIVMNKQITKNRTKKCPKCGTDGSGTKFRSCPAVVGKKKCGSKWDETIDPYAYIQIFIDKIPEINKNLINEAMNEVKTCIDNGVYPRNLTNCFNQYGKPCAYVNKCWRQNGK
jgi:RecB family exonuclease